MRAGILAAGLCLLLLGTGLLIVDEVALDSRISSQASLVLNLIGRLDESGRCHLSPPQWVPYAFAGIGLITMLYSVALPRE